MNVTLPNDMDLLPPSYDSIFKTLLTHPDAKPALISIASAIILRKVTDVVVRNNELPVMDMEEKGERFDVNCVVDDGDQVDIEMHGSRIEEPIHGEHVSLLNKSIYYLTDLHSSQKSKGVKYANLVRTYQATFCNYTVYPNHPDYITRASLRRENGEQVSDQINLVLVELSKLAHILKKPTHELTDLEAWSIFLQYAPDIQKRALVNRIIQERGEIAVAGALLMEISQDERERAKLRSRRMYETEQISNWLTAVDRERTLALKTVALNMKIDGDSFEKIARNTGLSVSEVEKL